MHKGREWRSHPRRDLRYFGRRLDYWPKRMTQRSSFGPVFGIDPTAFDICQSNPGTLNSDGCGLEWFWPGCPFATNMEVKFRWEFPTGPTNEHGTILVTFHLITPSLFVSLMANVNDCILHDGVYRHFALNDGNSTNLGPDSFGIDPPYQYDFWPWTYYDEPTEDS